MKKSNKILAVLLALVMIITAVPMTTVLADSADKDEHKHVYVIQSETEGSCTEAAKTVFKCSCGDVKVMEESEPAHTPATNGYKSKDAEVHTNYCTKCKKLYEEKHDFYEVYEEWVTPTCEKEGKEVYKCKYCDYKKTVVLKPSVHIPSGIVVKDDNKHSFTCKACEKLIDEEHVWDEGVLDKNVGCGDNGKITYTCQVAGCGKTKVETIPSTHIYVDKEDIEDGVAAKLNKYDEKGHTFECVYCSKDKVEEHEYVVEYAYTKDIIKDSVKDYGDPEAIIPFFAEAVAAPVAEATEETAEAAENAGETTTAAPCNHSYGKPVVTEATCTKDGSEVLKCTKCGHEKEKVLNATGHKWNEWEVKKAATCLEYGYKTRTCKNCDEVESEAIKATNKHNYEWVDRGNGTEVYVCSGCNWVKTSREYEWTQKVPTCKEEGKIKVSCKYCNYSYIATVDTVDHEIAEDAKYTQFSGEHHKTTCVYCGEVKMPHTWGEWEVTKQPTATENGEKARKCKDCGQIDTVVIEKGSAMAGDVDGNGKITAVDARLVLQYVAGLKTPTAAEKALADVNSDNNISAVDARIILQIVAGLK